MALQTTYRTLLHEPLWESGTRAPTKVAVHAGDHSITFGDLTEQADRLARALQSRGLRRGDRVGIFLDNTLEAAVSIFAVLRAGGVFVVINPQTKEDKLAFICSDCGIRALVTDVHLRSVVKAVAGTIPTLRQLVLTGAVPDPGDFTGPDYCVDTFTDLTTGDHPSLRDPGTIPTDLAALIYTSGSTGNPKGVMHTHQSMVFALGSVLEYLGLNEDDVILNVLPLAFDYGLYQLLMATALGATLVLERSFAFPGQVFGRMAQHGVTVVPGVPTIFSMLVTAHGRDPLSFPSVRRVTNTAAALPTGFLTTLSEIFPNAEIFAMYGLTECKRVSYLPPDLLHERCGSVGKPIPGTETFLRSPSGQEIPPGEPGILHVRGPHLMRGYWGAPERTAEMLVDGDVPGEKVLRTGDWFRMDDEGFLYFVGRSDDIIKTRGEKVSPVEVENALYSVPGVEEAVVVGVPDGLLGEAIRAYVVVGAGVEVDDRTLRRALSSRLENFMVPQEIVFRDHLPKGHNGKILRTGLT